VKTCKKILPWLSLFAVAAWFTAWHVPRHAGGMEKEVELRNSLGTRALAPTTGGDRFTGAAADSNRARSAAAVAAATDIVDEEAALLRLIAQLPVTDIRSCLQELRRDELSGNLGRLLVRQWASTSPEYAARWATTVEDPVAREELMASAALAWAGRDLPAALAWAESLPEGSAHERVLLDLGYELARTDPLEAIRLASKLPVTDSRDAMLLHALRQELPQDSDLIREWAAQLPPGAFREQALAAVAISIPDGPTAARLVAEQMAPGPERDRALIGVIQRWAQVDYDRTAAWVAGFPATPLRRTALTTLASVDPARSNNFPYSNP